MSKYKQSYKRNPFKAFMPSWVLVGVGILLLASGFAAGYFLRPIIVPGATVPLPTATSATARDRTALRVDLRTRQVWLFGGEVRLTQREFDLLALLAKCSPEVVSYREISLALWKQEYTSTIRKYINHAAFSLRKQLEKADPGTNLVLNFTGWGYKLLPEAQAVMPQQTIIDTEVLIS